MAGYKYGGTQYDAQPTTPKPTSRYDKPETTRDRTADRIKQAEELFADGASQNEVHKITGMSRATIRQYFPGKGWTKSQGAHLTNAKRRGE